jgi:hypothetical protein
MNEKRIIWDFTYHPPQTESQGDLFGMTRDLIKHVALILNKRLPDGREKSLAVTKLEEAMMWAMASIARADRPEDAK